MRTKCILLIALLIGCVTAFAQAPTLVNYQGRLVDASGEPLQTANRNLVINIFDTPTGNTKLYGPQEFSATPVVNGYFNILIGPVDESGKGIESAFMGGDAYLDITVNGTPMSPRQRIVSAPYALRATSATNAEVANAVPPGAIMSDMIDARAVGSAAIDDGAVELRHMSSDSVDSAAIKTGAVKAAEIATDAVGSDEIARNAVGAEQIAPDSVGSEHIADSSIISSDFSPGAIAPMAERLLPQANFKMSDVISTADLTDTIFKKVVDKNDDQKKLEVLAFETSGRPVLLSLKSNPGSDSPAQIIATNSTTFSSSTGHQYCNVEIQIKRKTSGQTEQIVLATTTQANVANNRSGTRIRTPASAIMAIDTPGAGTHDYWVEVKSVIPGSDNHFYTVTNCVLFVMELGGPSLP